MDTGPVSLLRKRVEGQNVPRFDLVLPDGAVHRFGSPEHGEASFSVRVRSKRGERAIEKLDLLAVGEAYIDEHLDIDGDFLAALDLRDVLTDFHPWYWLERFIRPLLVGKVASDKDTVTRHYDYGDDLYFAFLDRTARMYSQGFYRSDADSLEQAVRNKLEYISSICRLEPRSHVLDVGAGWGSFSMYAARLGMKATMMTIAREQYAYLSKLTASEPGGNLQVVYESIYAYAPGDRYDAIVLLGVTEHLPDYRALFRRLGRLLKPNGRVYLDFVATRKKYSISSFTYRHVFPGRGSPVVLPDLIAAADKEPFEIVALHNDRHSYFLTFRDWAANLEAAHEEISRRFGERAYRLFRLYLWATGHALKRGDLESYRIVFQYAPHSSSEDVGLAGTA